MNKDSRLWIFISVIALFVGAVGMYFLMMFFPLSETTINKLEKEVTVNDKGISDAVEKIYDAVVVVTTYKNNVAASSGSGFVYKKDGKEAYILTNNHVVSGGNKIEVTFSDGKTYEVKLVGNEVYSDIAVLSIDSDKIISVAEIGKSDETKLGDTVFTVGAPIGSNYSGTVTRGILSGKDRMVEVNMSNSSTSDYVMKVIQTDAAINSGNSGGPLSNSNGQVIGITSLKLVSTGVEGIGFAITIEDAIYYATLLEEKGEIARPYLGINMAETSDVFLLLRYGITVPENAVGVVVANVVKDSPADDAGLEIGDIITSIGGESIKSVAELKYELFKHSPGDKVEIQYVRQTTVKKATAKLGELE